MKPNTVSMLVVLLFGGLATAWVGGCDSAKINPGEMLKLSWREFEQSPDSGWRPVADRHEYARAAELIEYYIRNKTGLEAGQIGYLHFHAAVLCAYEEREERAIDHLRSASVDSFPAAFPQSWNALVRGTLGFMLQDMESVRDARNEIVAMHALTARDSSFLEALEHLSTKEGMSYWEATASWRD